VAAPSDAPTTHPASTPKAVVASAAVPAAPGGAADSTPTTAAPAAGTYEVRRGDTLSVIARRLGVDMQDLIAANRLANAHRLRVGQTLLVPGEGESFEPFVPELYTVQRGDSVWEVAARFDLERDQVMTLNDLRAGQHIYIGQKLRLLPASGSAASSTGE
jgi:LysM repeat protein